MQCNSLIAYIVLLKKIHHSNFTRVATAQTKHHGLVLIVRLPLQVQRTWPSGGRDKSVLSENTGRVTTPNSLFKKKKKKKVSKKFITV